MAAAAGSRVSKLLGLESTRIMCSLMRRVLHEQDEWENTRTVAFATQRSPGLATHCALNVWLVEELVDEHRF